jgi:hypothetical protein
MNRAQACAGRSARCLQCPLQRCSRFHGSREGWANTLPPPRTCLGTKSLQVGQAKTRASSREDRVGQLPAEDQQALGQ